MLRTRRKDLGEKRQLVGASTEWTDTVGRVDHWLFARYSKRREFTDLRNQVNPRQDVPQKSTRRQSDEQTLKTI